MAKDKTKQSQHSGPWAAQRKSRQVQVSGTFTYDPERVESRYVNFFGVFFFRFFGHFCRALSSQPCEFLHMQLQKPWSEPLNCLVLGIHSPTSLLSVRWKNPANIVVKTSPSLKEKLSTSKH